MKSQAVRELAERMYVQENRTYADIATIMDVTEKTVWSWGQPGAGNWETKRENFLKSKTASYEEQYNMLISVCKQIRTALDSNLIPHQNLITLYNNLTSGIKKTKEYEDGMAAAQLKAQETGKKTIKPETFAQIEGDLFGL